MAGTIEINGTGGIIEGNLGSANVNVNLDSSLNFDGTDDVLTIADAASLDQTGDFTIAVWVRPDTFDSNDRIIARGATGSGDFMISAGSSRRVRVYCKDVNGNAKDTVDTFSAIPLDAWSHLTVVFDRSNNKIQLSINGAAFEEFTGGDTWNGNICNGSNPLRIGFNGSSNYFDGRIADVRFYNTALTIDNAKILASKILSNENLGAGTTNLIGWWKLNNNSITDSSTNSNNASATGTNEVYDDYSVDVYDNSTTTDGTFTITQGKVEGLALSSLALDGNGDYVNLSNTAGDLEFGDGSNDSPFTLSAWIKADDATSATIYGRDRELKFGFSSSDKLFLALYDETTSHAEIQLSTDALTSIENKWTHVVATYSGVGGTSANAGINLYVDGVAIAMTATDAGTYTAMHNNINADSRIGAYVSADYFDGDIRDFKLFDYELSAEQVASMYSNTYPQTPYHGYKMDEGVGQVNATDYGTSSTTINGTLHGNAAMGDSNGTLNLDGKLTIGSSGDSSVKATVSAPRGILHLKHDLQSFGTLIHNNGTFKLDNHSSMHTYNVAGGANQRELTFHNLTMEGTGGDGYRIGGPITIEKDWIINGTRTSVSNNAGGGHNSGVVVTLGTTTSAGSITINSGKELETYVYANDHSVTYQGVSPLYPALFTNNGTFEETLGSLLETTPEVKFGNMKFAQDFITRPDDGDGSGGSKITLIGDMEFEAFTLRLADDTLDLNGQRAKLSGTLTGAGTVACGTNALIETAGIINFDNSGTWSGNCNIISTVSANHYLKPSTVAAHNITNLFLKDGANPQRWQNNFVQNIIVGGGTQNFGDPPPTTGPIENITIATGATLNGADRTLTFDGDFTTSGGLIGKSGLDFDGTASKVDCGTDSSLSLTNNFTLEAWIKPDTVSGEKTIISRGVTDNASSQYTFKLNSQQLRLTKEGIGNFDSGTNVITTTGKWYHVAVTVSSSDGIKFYVDGKLVGVDTNTSNCNSSSGNLLLGSRWNASEFFDGVIDMARIFNDVRTESEIRSNMFSQLASSEGGLVAQYVFDEGTGGNGDPTADSSANSNTGTLGPAGNAPNFVAAGTFTAGTSTVVMAKSGTQTIAYTHLDNDFDSLTINAGSTTQMLSVGESGNNALQDINENLTVNGILKSHPDTTSSRIRLRDPSATFTVDSSVKDTALADLSRLQFNGVGTFNCPELTTQKIIISSSNTQVSASGNLTITSELECDNGTTFNANGNTINCYILDMKTGSTIDLRNSTLKATASAGRTFQLLDSTLLSGNSIIQGFNSTKPVDLFCTKDGNHELVGTLQDCEVQDDGDITVIGSVIRCTFDESRSNIRQFFHTLDTQQLLDADEAGDDDLKLEKPALDNAVELQTG